MKPNKHLTKTIDAGNVLHYAALAAGYWNTEYNIPDNFPHIGWNPLNNMIDAFRLAQRMGLTVRFDENYIEIESPLLSPSGEYGTDYPAFCRAVTWYVAAIGLKYGTLEAFK